MESEHRKIELQSPGDLAFLTSQLRTAARRKLDLHLPPVSDTSEPDELRKNVEELVDAFVAQVLMGMRNNISINGIDVVERGREGDEVDMHGDKMEGIVEDGASLVEKEEYEVFDEKLRSKVGTTIAKRDALIAKISQHRRTTPAAAAAAFETQFQRESDAFLQAQDEIVVGEQDIADVQALARNEEVRKNWERAVEGLGRLNKGLPETRARLERAGDVVGYLGGSVEQN
ncbi:hypothetical protein BKA63DRAFT_504719 [Paraphoma chrysanthemicola]|nr:hypothetical protein BKA63DRAFT_504719 [Paraphoma chrysanthemicola]